MSAFSFWLLYALLWTSLTSYATEDGAEESEEAPKKEEAQESGEAILYASILEGYSPFERPVKNHTSAVRVQMKIELQQIVDIVSLDIPTNRDYIFFRCSRMRKTKLWK